MPRHLILSHCASTQLNQLNTRYLRGNHKSETYHRTCKESAITQVCLMTFGASLHPVLIHVLLQNESSGVDNSPFNSAASVQRGDRRADGQTGLYVEGICRPKPAVRINTGSLQPLYSQRKRRSSAVS